MAAKANHEIHESAGFNFMKSRFHGRSGMVRLSVVQQLDAYLDHQLGDLIIYADQPLVIDKNPTAGLEIQAASAQD